MHKKGTYYLLVFLTITASFFSCVTQKKVISVKKEITTVDSQLQKYSTALKQLDTKREMKQEQNQIDDKASARIQKFIAKTRTEIDTLHAQNTILIVNTIVDRADWQKLLKTLSLSRKSSKTIGDKIQFLSDLINRNMVVKIDQDVLFAPGQYIVTPAIAASIGNLFEPAAKEIDTFIKKYPAFPLSIVITVKGYADATAISEGTPLYKDLKARLSMSNADPDNKELNKQLSRVRAEQVKALFEKYTTDKSGTGHYIPNILYLSEGKGEALPNPTITDYKIDDARRRVVLLFWSIFPE